MTSLLKHAPRLKARHSSSLRLYLSRQTFISPVSFVNLTLSRRAVRLLAVFSAAPLSPLRSACLSLPHLSWHFFDDSLGSRGPRSPPSRGIYCSRSVISAETVSKMRVSGPVKRKFALRADRDFAKLLLDNFIICPLLPPPSFRSPCIRWSCCWRISSVPFFRLVAIWKNEEGEGEKEGGRARLYTACSRSTRMSVRKIKKEREVAALFRDLQEPYGRW